MAHWWILFKTLVRSTLDNYVLPGTSTGTDILVVYMSQWMRHFAVLTSATFYLVFSQFELSRTERVWSETTEEISESEPTRHSI